MKTVMQNVSKILFALFAGVVFLLTMSFSFSALQRVYPDSLFNVAMGLVLFDIGALVWALVFVYKSKGGAQRAGAFVLFGWDFVGTLGLVAIEIMLGGQSYVKVADWVGQSLVWIFIGSAAMNVIGVYFHHGTEQAVLDEIENQSAADEVTAEARRQAAENNQANLRELGGQVAVRIDADVRNRLGLPLAAAEGLFGGSVGLKPSVIHPQPVQEQPPASDAGFRESQPEEGL